MNDGSPRLAKASRNDGAETTSVHDLTQDDLAVFYQPIVDVETRSIFAYEALARCRVPSLSNPQRLFERAVEQQACGALGRAVRQLAIARSPNTRLFNNVHPAELAARWLIRPDDPLNFHDHQVYIEVTESAAFTHHELCLSVLKELKSRGGVHLAVDDLGAGHSNLKRIIDLEPEVVKLDRALIYGLDKSRRQQTLVKHVVELCVELDALVVAEGIETHDEFQAVLDTGAHLLQGFLLARPGYPAPDSIWPVPPSTASESGEPVALPKEAH
jgi:EAL domain-containing protein (putative c-di-GMP-specific phosphodiesterase class I)